ncbi:MAG: flagellar hook-basal body complex protein FliE [Sulfurimicrobium sp.]|jgi:flagellar hook-basal body complex protein FliE|nr:flagellar hook-basal body complex protein FliE [Sulfurimicrobium sp.]MDO9191123.1 flagellar hook-basal body complex protein FliE [Sulfurimicrobium sp.]MDP1705367.1 flagellar hook-basal body complex protein FliE [Sulfurimicrobium sp.]MDP1898689.1 flagellar hook-basal body complex protein FliE [Sulfurimicrobium sp.]MDP2200370.1 flagellar hook-basal body complex protein FliE [Sulfurimicrobium sp.]
MNIQGIDQLLSQMQATAAVAAGGSPQQAPQGGADFAALLKNSVDQVNSAQQESSAMAKNFELGETDASLQEVMISLQKANVSFQAMVQVRNKLVSAYQDIMNMQV